jgi:hypothetical protein
MEQEFVYEISDNLEIRIWNITYPNPGGEPSIFQPDKPDGSDWESYEEAEAWALEFIESLKTPEVLPQESIEEEES